MTTNEAIGIVRTELRAAQEKFPPFRSAHEGLAIIEEEFEELKRDVFWPRASRMSGSLHHTHMLREAQQVAAMAIRFMVDLGGEK